MAPALLLAQQYTWNVLPQNMFPDSTHAPFVLGVASSEPGTDHIYLWTYAEPDSLTQTAVVVNWELAFDSSFTAVVQSGTDTARSTTSWSMTFKVDGLDPDTYYWYRFEDDAGNYSVIGRTRTMPINSDNIRLAIGSCSNPIAFYNSYGRLAEQEDLSAILHLGDWSYDKLNENRSVRYPDPAPNIRCGLDERRKRDYLTLLDPDLRAARQMHPFIYLWDNHDIQKGDPEVVKDTCRQVFFEFTGQPIVDSSELARQYRKISMGNMIDLFIVDVQYKEDRRDTIYGQESYLGAAQKAWLLTELQNSTATWKLIGQQKLFTSFSVQGLESIIPGGVNSDEKSWEGYDHERTEILEFIRDNEIDNIIMLSGDAHFVVVADVPVNPFDSTVYNGNTGDGSVCVEFLPSGLSSPNIDERGISYGLQSFLQDVAYNLNPHHLYDEFMDNGYGILEMTPDSVTAQVFLLSAQTVNTDQYLASELTLYEGANHWYRDPSVGIDKLPETPVKIGVIAVYPNPAKDELTIEFLSKQITNTQAIIFDVTGKQAITQSIDAQAGTNLIDIDLSSLPKGTYILKLTGELGGTAHKFVKQ